MTSTDTNAKRRSLYWFLSSIDSLSYLPFVSGYCIACSVLYLWAYWGTFSINVLKYLSFTVVVKTAAFPVASSFFGIAVLIAFVDGCFSTVNRWLHDGSKRLKGAVGLVGLLALLGLLIFYVIKYREWLMILLAYAIFLEQLALKTSFLEGVFITDRVRAIAIFLLILLPFFSYFVGLHKSEILLKVVPINTLYIHHCRILNCPLAMMTRINFDLLVMLVNSFT